MTTHICSHCGQQVRKAPAEAVALLDLSEWGRRELLILMALVDAWPRRVHKESMVPLVYDFREEPENPDNAIEAHICKMVPRLERYGFTIESKRFLGYRLLGSGIVPVELVDALAKLPLTPHQRRAMDFLLRNRDRYVTAEEFGRFITRKQVKAYAYALRKIMAKAGIGWTIDSRLKNGYRLVPNAEATSRGRFTPIGRRVVKTVLYGGKRRSIPDLAREHGVAEGMLYSRLARGWDVDRALSEPPDMRKVPAQYTMRAVTLRGQMPAHAAKGWS